MRYYGYHRTSTTDQHLDRGLTAITDYCKANGIELQEIFTDQQTGKAFDRPGYMTLKKVLREGDVLIISEIDRLGRNKMGTRKELEWLKENGVRLMVLEIPTTLQDYSAMEDGMAKLMMDMVNNLMIEIYITMAEAEMQKKEKRQREGLEAMRARGDWDKMGRQPIMPQEDFNKAYDDVAKGNIPPFVLMREMNMKKSTFYRYKKIYDESHQVTENTEK